VRVSNAGADVVEFQTRIVIHDSLGTLALSKKTQDEFH
jgi:hypothetical protein